VLFHWKVCSDSSLDWFVDQSVWYHLSSCTDLLYVHGLSALNTRFDSYYFFSLSLKSEYVFQDVAMDFSTLIDVSLIVTVLALTWSSQVSFLSIKCVCFSSSINQTGRSIIDVIYIH
jgi:hypothetical protein